MRESLCISSFRRKVLQDCRSCFSSNNATPLCIRLIIFCSLPASKQLIGYGGGMALEFRKGNPIIIACTVLWIK